jgi:MFS family permease
MKRLMLIFTISLIMAGTFADAVDLTVVQGFIATLQDKQHLSYLQVVLLVNMATLCYGVLAVPLALLADRTRRTPIIAGGGVLSALIIGGTFFFAFAFIPLLLFRTLSGVGDASYTAQMQSLGTDSLPEKKHGMFFGGQGVVSVLGSMAGGFIGDYVANTYGIATVFPLVAVLILVTFALFVFVREPLHIHTTAPAAFSWRTVRATMVANLRVPLLRAALLGLTFLTVTTATLGSLVAIFFHKAYGLSSESAGFLILPIFGCAALGNLIGGIWDNRWAARRARHERSAPLAYSRPFIAGSSTVIGSIVFVASVLLHPATIIEILAACCASTCYSIAAPPLQALVAHVTPVAQKTTGFMMQGVLVALVTAALFILFGQLADAIQAISFIMALASVPALVIGGVLLLVARRHWLEGKHAA